MGATLVATSDWPGCLTTKYRENDRSVPGHHTCDDISTVSLNNHPW